MKTASRLLTAIVLIIAATIFSGSSCNKNDVVKTKTCWNGKTIPVNENCPPETKTCWNGQVIPIAQACPDECPTCSKWMTTQPSLTAPANVSIIKAGERKSAGNLTVANSSTAVHSTNLTFTFSGAGAGAVDSIIFTFGNVTYPKKISNNTFTLEGVSVPVGGITDIKLEYRLVSNLPAGMTDGSQINLALTALTTDEAGVTQPGTKTFPAAINLDKVYVPAVSAWLSKPVITYANPFAIIGNACSNPLTISITNTSSSSKVLKSMTGYFGDGGTAVKMLRYKLNGSAWTVLPAVNGTVTFSNITLAPGANTFDCIFALKEFALNENGKPLIFTITSIDDNEGGGYPIGGVFPTSVNVGSVNGTTQATKITSEWLGYMNQLALNLNPDGNVTGVVYNVTNIQATGPANARVASIKLRNPYGNALIWNSTTWKFNSGTNSYQISQSEVVWNSDMISISMPTGSIITMNNTYTSFTIWVNVRNSSPTEWFRSTNTTPGLYGLQLMSKYDIVLLNSDNQMIDLSQVVVKQGSTNILTN